MTNDGSTRSPVRASGVVALTISALGVVFGDIGTSPLYTLHACVAGPEGEGARATPADVLGVLSLIFWSLTMVIGVKYLSFIMRADNDGEGGILALLALVPPKLRSGPLSVHIGWAAALVLTGAALLYGDGIITPSISVLSAVEGLSFATKELEPVVVPLTCVILVGLFAVQHRGTAVVGRFFGPVMLLWFVTIGALGARQIVLDPRVLAALSPHHGAAYFARHGLRGVAVLGGVVLAITGGEALYADMGHFGARPIRLGWWCVAMPALVLDYFGQGALLLREPAAAEGSSFFALVPPGAATYALVALSTAATIIASQALISGAFSLTHQAVRLGFLPRLRIRHTSRVAEGQIYVPVINWTLMVACLVLVLAFRRSSRLAAAYGVAVTGTMAITSIVFFVVAHRTWRWPTWKAAAIVALFLSFDLPFFGANLLKLFDGGYVPLVAGAVVLFLMITWKQGRALLLCRLTEGAPSVETFVEECATQSLTRAPGTGVYMASRADRTTSALLHHARRMHVLPERVVLFTLVTERSPAIAIDASLEVAALGHGFYRVLARTGFMDHPRVPRLVNEAMARLSLGVSEPDVTYYIGRETLLATSAGKMGAFRESVFAFMSRNAEAAGSYFGIAPDQVVELGAQYDL